MIVLTKSQKEIQIQRHGQWLDISFVLHQSLAALLVSARVKFFSRAKRRRAGLSKPSIENLPSFRFSLAHAIHTSLNRWRYCQLVKLSILNRGLWNIQDGRAPGTWLDSPTYVNQTFYLNRSIFVHPPWKVKGCCFLWHLFARLSAV